ncbi:MAG: PepSY-like domain-containing protein [Porphyromonadaceae bacterium]|nr:PepSY-like domain-containing protein [Porphyromonadaceae bacterium]
MRKFLGLALVAIIACTVAFAGQDRIIPFENLPKKAQVFVKQYFGNQSISLVKQETEILSKTYDVIFASGDKIEFDGSGQWKEIDCRTELPEGVVPAAINDYLIRNHPNLPARKIERQFRGRFEVKLANGLELTLTSSGRVVGVDD